MAASGLTPVAISSMADPGRPGTCASLIAARFPRSYIDANRSILDIDAQLLAEPWPGPVQAGSKTQRGIGLVWRLIDTGEPIYARPLSVDEIKRRITHFHQPYQRAVKDALDPLGIMNPGKKLPARG